MNPSLPRMDDEPYRAITTADGSFVVCLQHRLTKDAVSRGEALALARSLNIEYQKRMAL